MFPPTHQDFHAFCDLQVYTSTCKHISAVFNSVSKRLTNVQCTELNALFTSKETVWHTCNVQVWRWGCPKHHAIFHSYAVDLPATRSQANNLGISNVCLLKVCCRMTGLHERTIKSWQLLFDLSQKLVISHGFHEPIYSEQSKLCSTHSLVSVIICNGNKRHVKWTGYGSFLCGMGIMIKLVPPVFIFFTCISTMSILNLQRCLAATCT